jgi:hypothetical protein
MICFFEKIINKTTQVLSIICTTICLQFTLYTGTRRSMNNGDTIFFPHWPYILFIERRVPVPDATCSAIRNNNAPIYEQASPNLNFISITRVGLWCCNINNNILLLTYSLNKQEVHCMYSTDLIITYTIYSTSKARYQIENNSGWCRLRAHEKWEMWVLSCRK